MHLSGIDRFLWAATFLGHCLLLFVMVARRRAGVFPALTTLIAASVVRTVVLYFVSRYLSESAYFYSYWQMAVVDETLQLFVIYEVASHVFCPVGVWAEDVRSGCLWMAGGSLMIAGFLTWLALPAVPLRIQSLIIRVNFFSATLMSELFVGMLVLSTTAGLPWKTHVARIGQGLGTYSVVCVVTEAAKSYFGILSGTKTYTALSEVRIVTYVICLGYWIVTLWREAPVPRALPPAMRLQLFNLRQKVEDDLLRARTWRT